VETDASNYALATILSIMNEENEVQPIAFHFYTFTIVELNYRQRITNHKDLEYFSAIKMLT